MKRGFDFSKSSLLLEYFKNKDKVQEIMDYGERITHLYPNNCFFAHLSLYYLALAFIKPKSVILDAGCGAGYGSAFLADRTEECKIYGVELDEKAIDFCRENFVAPNLEYLQMDLENISGFKDNFFDFVISSNVLEHIEHVDLFLSRICDLLKPN